MISLIAYIKPDIHNLSAPWCQRGMPSFLYVLSGAFFIYISDRPEL